VQPSACQPDSGSIVYAVRSRLRSWACGFGVPSAVSACAYTVFLLLFILCTTATWNPCRWFSPERHGSSSSSRTHATLQHSRLVRSRRRRNKLDGPYDNRIMPIVLSATLIVALSITFGSSVVAYEHDS